MRVGVTRPFGASGIKLTALGFGTASIGNFHGTVNESEAMSALATAWSLGIRYFDTAPLYGRGLGELRVGHVLRDHAGDEFVLSTKVGWRISPLDGAEAALHEGIQLCRVEADYSRAGALRSLEDSLARTGLEQLDIVVIHDIDAYNHGVEGQRRRFREAMEGALPALSDLRAAGIVRAIGVAVNDWRVCDSVLDHATVDGFILASGFTLLNHATAMPFLERCFVCGVGVVAAAPFHSGLLARGTAVRGIARYNYVTASPDIVELVRRLESVCASYRISLAAAALHFPLRHPAIASVLPGPRSAQQVCRSVRAFEETIPEDFWSELIAASLIEPALARLDPSP